MNITADCLHRKAQTLRKLRRQLWAETTSALDLFRDPEQDRYERKTDASKCRSRARVEIDAFIELLEAELRYQLDIH